VKGGIGDGCTVLEINVVWCGEVMLGFVVKCDVRVRQILKIENC
jgi:hypothetical protein